MFGSVILLEVPVQEARIDLLNYEISPGFLGFGMVPLSAWHYVSVKVGQHHVGFWCYPTSPDTVVQVFDPRAQRFVAADPATQAHYGRLASRREAPASVLIPYAHAKFGPWYGLVKDIPQENFPPKLHAAEPEGGTRFDRAFAGTHGSEVASFLAEFQYAFAAWFVSLASAAPDQRAFDRWMHLVRAAYHAGEDAIGAAGELFRALVDTLLRQFALLDDPWFTGESVLASSSAQYMAEDMRDTGVEALAASAAVFLEYLAQRRH